MNQELGSLAQSARGNQLKSARWILIFVGVLTIGINGFMLATNDARLEKEAAELRGQGYEIDEAALASLASTTKLTCGGFVALGVVFVLLGIFVYQFPVPCTVAGLVLYIVAAGLGALIDPMTLAKGLLVKILIVVGLVKSVKSALAYTDEA